MYIRPEPFAAFASFAAAAALALLTPPAVQAYYIEVRGSEGTAPIRYADGDEASPDTVDVTYVTNESTIPSGASGADGAIDAAFATWSAADCASLTFSRGASTDSTDRAHWMSDGGEVYVLVYFTDSDSEWTGGPSVGHFYYGFDPTGALLGGTVVLNSRDHAWATDGSLDAIDVQGTVTALIGRALGITSAMDGNATYPRYAPGDTTKRELGADDLAAVAYLYPTGEASCDPLTPPEAECDGFMRFGEEPCTPQPDTDPGDGGTAMPRADAGPLPIGTDAGTPTADGGDGGGGGEGGCSASPGRGAGGAGALAMLAVAALLRRRRR